MNPENSPASQRATSLYDYSDPSIKHAAIAVVAYAALRVIGAVAGSVVQPGLSVYFALDALLIGGVLAVLAFFIRRRSRVAVVLALVFIVGTQLYIWFGTHSLSGTLVAVIVTGFLLRGATRIFQEHRERQDAPDAGPAA